MGNRVREFRQKAGLSQAELARRTHVASPNLSAVENDQRVAWPKLRRRLARSLKTTEAELFPAEEGGEMENSERLTYSIPEVCAILGISRNLGYELARRGELPGLIRLGGKRVVCSKLAIEKLLSGEVGNDRQ